MAAEKIYESALRRMQVLLILIGLVEGSVAFFAGVAQGHYALDFTLVASHPYPASD